MCVMVRVRGPRRNVRMRGDLKPVRPERSRVERMTMTMANPNPNPNPNRAKFAKYALTMPV